MNPKQINGAFFCFATKTDVYPWAKDNKKGSLFTGRVSLVRGHPSITVRNITPDKKTQENHPGAVIPDEYVLRASSNFKVIYPQKNARETRLPAVGEVIHVSSYYTKWNTWTPGDGSEIAGGIEINIRAWQFVRLDGVVATQKPGTFLWSEDDAHAMGDKVITFDSAEIKGTVHAEKQLEPCIVSGRFAEFDERSDVDSAFSMQNRTLFGMRFGAMAGDVRVSIAMRKGMEADFGIEPVAEGTSADQKVLEVYKNVFTAVLGAHPIFAGVVDTQATYDNGLCNNPCLIVNRASLVMPTRAEMELIGVPVSAEVATAALTHLPDDGNDPMRMPGARMRIIFGKHLNNAATIAASPLCYLVPRPSNIVTVVDDPSMPALLREVNAEPMEKRLDALLAGIQKKRSGFRTERFVILCVTPSDMGSDKTISDMVAKYYASTAPVVAAPPAADDTGAASGAAAPEAAPPAEVVSAAPPAVAVTATPAAKRPSGSAPGPAKRAATSTV